MTNRNINEAIDDLRGIIVGEITDYIVDSDTRSIEMKAVPFTDTDAEGRQVQRNIVGISLEKDEHVKYVCKETDSDGNPVTGDLMELSTVTLYDICKALWPERKPGKESRRKKYYKVTVKHVQYYSHSFLVKAASAGEAKTLFLEDWSRGGYAYDKTTKYFDDTDTDVCVTPAEKGNENKFNILND